MTDYSRRTILKFAALTPLTVPIITSCAHDVASIENIAAQLVSNLNYPKRTTELGLTHIRLTPGLEKFTYQQITNELLQRFQIDSQKLSRDSLTSLDILLRQQVRQDFIDEDIVILRGWMLSKTEALLCALHATYI